MSSKVDFEITTLLRFSHYGKIWEFSKLYKIKFDNNEIAFKSKGRRRDSNSPAFFDKITKKISRDCVTDDVTELMQPNFNFMHYTHTYVRHCDTLRAEQDTILQRERAAKEKR